MGSAMLQDGIYVVNFSAQGRGAGGGLIVVREGLLNGGDPMFLFRGRLQQVGLELVGKVSVKRWNKNAPPGTFPLFPVDSYEIQLKGSAADKAFTVRGAGPGNIEILVEGNWLDTLAS